MKTVYFVRHGQSEANADIKKQQIPGTLLTRKGEEQAHIVAEHLAKLPLDGLISSTYVRAEATAERIHEKTHLPIHYSDLFIEWRRPSVQMLKGRFHPSWLWAQFHILLNRNRSSYRYSDEETIDELFARARAALLYVEQMPGEHIVVVTHGAFMRCLYSLITYGDNLTAKLYVQTIHKMFLRNTALMVATRDDDVWAVTHWNEDASAL
ncbi:MAG: histidine phosphatase family protein [Parcubacteria group bacterium]|nr:histidine phosphatase family protein [Parcubacteria group bacterium]